MRILLFLFVLIFCFVGTAYSYPQSQMDECISSALNNPATQSISRILIKNYCDCALKEIIDEKKDIRESGYRCAVKNFN